MSIQPSGRALVGVVVTVGVLAAYAAACGSSGKSSAFGGDGGGGGPGNDGGVTPFEAGTFGGDGSISPSMDANIDPDAFWAMDPPPMWCGPDGGEEAAVAPGGTPDCPSDKNRQGCPCPMAGQSAACWPGLRADRDRGQCKDGTTTCTMNGEFDLEWGPCVGYVLPTPGATTGAAACKCFSSGAWVIANLVPCFIDYMPDIYAVSTYESGGQPTCPMGSSTPPPQPQPGTTWSSDTIKTDCEGHFKLCYTLKAGSAMSPQASDCVVASVCTEDDYTTANVVQPFPDLPSWVGSDPVCAASFYNTGGYGEMSVIGESVTCDAVDNGMGQPFVFNRVQYCALSCQTNPSAPGCSNCGAGGGGTF